MESRETVPAVMQLRPDHSRNEPYVHCKKVTPAENRSEPQGQYVDHCVFDGMSVAGGESDRRFEFVMLFVEALVERRVVHCGWGWG